MSKKIDNSGIILLGVLILFFLFIIFLVIYANNNRIPELTQGEKSNFCYDKRACGIYKTISSNNNSQYNFIRCECLIEGGIDASLSGSRTKTKSEIRYFDSRLLNLIEEEEVIERILNKN